MCSCDVRCQVHVFPHPHDNRANRHFYFVVKKKKLQHNLHIKRKKHFQKYLHVPRISYNMFTHVQKGIHITPNYTLTVHMVIYRIHLTGCGNILMLETVLEMSWTGTVALVATWFFFILFFILALELEIWYRLSCVISHLEL